VGHPTARRGIMVDVVELFVLLLVTPDIHAFSAPVPNPAMRVMMRWWVVQIASGGSPAYVTINVCAFPSWRKSARASLRGGKRQRAAVLQSFALARQSAGNPDATEKWGGPCRPPHRG
jgi:hypothetical protein